MYVGHEKELYSSGSTSSNWQVIMLLGLWLNVGLTENVDRSRFTLVKLASSNYVGIPCPWVEKSPKALQDIVIRL